MAGTAGCLCRFLSSPYTDASAIRELMPTRPFTGMAILLGLASAFAPSIARGQGSDFNSCLNSCFSVCDSGPANLAWGCRENCGNQCSHRGGAAAPAPYGSIAVGSNGAEGMSWNKTSSAEADREAVRYCNKSGNDCKVVYRYRDTCAAVAFSRHAEHFESATGGSTKEAEANATAACQQRWGFCRSNMSSCSLLNASARSSAPPPARAVSWGAIAYSAPDHQAGWSSAKNDRTLAEREAMSVCSQRGKACEVVTTFNKKCGALARDGNFVGLATSTDQREALQKAVQECTRNGGSRCVPQVLFCSY